MKNLSPRVLLAVTLLAPSVALAAPPSAPASSTPPVKHHRHFYGAVRTAVGIAGAMHSSRATSRPTSTSSAKQTSSASAATSSSSAHAPSTSSPVPGSSVPVPRTSSPSHGTSSTPTPRPVAGSGSTGSTGSNGGGFGHDAGNGTSNNDGSSVGSTIGQVQSTLSTIEQALLTAAMIAQILHNDSTAHPHIPLPTPHPGTPAPHGTSTSTASSDSSPSSTPDEGSSEDSTDSSSPATPAANDAPAATHADAANAPPATADAASDDVASAATDAPSSGTPLRSPSSGADDGSSSCELSKTKLPSVLDGTNIYCPTCVKGALAKLGDGVAQANALSAGALRQRDSIEQIVHIEETGVATGDYAAISADGAKVEYGAYQFSRASGQLEGVIRSYVQMEGANAQSVGVLKSYLHTIASGAPLSGDHVFTDALRQAAKDPMMKKAQDAYFEQEYLVPAIADASKLGLRSPLAAAVLVDLKTNGGYASVMKAARKAVPTVANADDEKRFIAAVLDARDARYKALGAKPSMHQYLKTWLSRDKDFRNILASGNTDLAGEVKLATGSFCGGNGDDAHAFGLFMAKQGASGNGSGSSAAPTVAQL